uniref:Sulfate ABC transporter ATP-binding subunit n=1 Tax=Dichotomosiphon tuberosus TaxID=118263 RepID=A0A386AWY0_9CHLO|nr:Sulfate ABC transporter ATP-binding subunit [Dichotomosiphon tuberosus]
MHILIEDVCKNYNFKIVLNHINLEIKKNSLVAILGPSGSGKSTLLRIIAGFEKPTLGRIWLFGKNATNIPVQKRQIGFVFQDYGLFKNFTVFKNIAFGQYLKNEFNISKINDLLNLIELDKFSNFYPDQLSGGQKQRIAFARALTIEPKILLLDEPFGALDIQVRKKLRIWLKYLHEKLSLTIIFVTHDQQEAMELANEVIILNKGRVEQMGSPEEICRYPATEFIKNFLSSGNLNK